MGRRHLPKKEKKEAMGARGERRQIESIHEHGPYRLMASATTVERVGGRCRRGTVAPRAINGNRERSDVSDNRLKKEEGIFHHP
jgi:hypothetical protein